MSDKEKDQAAVAVIGITGTILLIAFCWWFFPNVGQWWTNTLFPVKDYYCASLKKIVKADPIYEDNGKYEDEAFKVQYDDGSVGLVDDATMRSGYYCVSQSWIKPIEAERKGWVLAP